MEGEYVSEIVLELQPRSRRGYRRWLGLRENVALQVNTFDRERFTERFLRQFNRRVLQRGQHIKCDGWIVAVKRIGSERGQGNTRVEYRLKGKVIDEAKGKCNESFVMETKEPEQYRCYCCECKRCLSEGDLFLKTTDWTRPIVCLSCYEDFFAPKCVRCCRAISFDRAAVTSDGLVCIRFVEHNDFYWHTECCVCVTCSQSLINRKFHQEEEGNQLLCLEHLPVQYL